jgi:hypothetical protein
MMLNAAAGYWCSSNSRRRRRLCGMLLQANEVAATARSSRSQPRAFNPLAMHVIAWVG